MNFKEYTELAGKTELKDYYKVKQFLGDSKNVKLFHYIMGLSGEVGEIVDSFKKSAVYDRPLDVVNLKEELGDVLWFIARMVKVLDTDIESIMQLNINKLKTRFGESFSEDKANNRDLNKELKVLSGESGE